jgi:hypothetical protein
VFLDSIDHAKNIRGDDGNLRPGLITRSRQISRSPDAGDNRLNLYSAVSAG